MSLINKLITLTCFSNDCLWINHMALSLILAFLNFSTDVLSADGLIGIDLGTNYVRIGVYINDTVILVPNTSKNLKIPLWVTFLAKDELLVGDEALTSALSHATSTMYGLPALLGTSAEEPAFWYMNKDRLYNITTKKDHIKIHFNINGHHPVSTTPEKLLALILHHVKHTTEEYLDFAIESVFLAVSAALGPIYRKNMMDIAKASGLRVSGLINRAMAVAIGFTAAENPTDGQVLVISLDGSSIDVAAVQLSSGFFSGKTFQVLASLSQWNLGTDYAVHSLVNFLVKSDTVLKEFVEDKAELFKLRREMERAMKQLLPDQDLFWRVKIKQRIFEGRVPSTTVNKILSQDFLSPIKKLVAQVMSHDMESDCAAYAHKLLITSDPRIFFIEQFLKAHLFCSLEEYWAGNGENFAVHGTTMAAVAEELDISIQDVSTHTLLFDGKQMITRNTELPSSKRFLVPVVKETEQINIFMSNSIKDEKKSHIVEYTVMDIPPELVYIHCKMVLDANGLMSMKAFTAGHGVPLDVFNNTALLSDYDIEVLSKSVSTLYENSYRFCKNRLQKKENMYTLIYKLYDLLEFESVKKKEKYYKELLKIEDQLSGQTCSSIAHSEMEEKHLYVAEMIESITESIKEN